MSSVREAVRNELHALAQAWQRRFRRCCDWCGAALSEADLSAYVDWCLELGKLLHPSHHQLPAAKVFCVQCAGGAITELVDGIRYAPGRHTGPLPPDPGARTASSPPEPEREWYP